MHFAPEPCRASKLLFLRQYNFLVSYYAIPQGLERVANNYTELASSNYFIYLSSCNPSSLHLTMVLLCHSISCFTLFGVRGFKRDFMCLLTWDVLWMANLRAAFERPYRTRKLHTDLQDI
jgi:hypothetical protein